MDFDERVWYPVYKCPLCGYKTVVTNMCRECPETPADRIVTMPVYCYVHKKAHFDENGQPVMHRSVRMERTGWAERFNPIIQRRERRKIKNLPENAILRE